MRYKEIEPRKSERQRGFAIGFELRMTQALLDVRLLAFGGHLAGCLRSDGTESCLNSQYPSERLNSVRHRSHCPRIDLRNAFHDVLLREDV